MAKVEVLDQLQGLMRNAALIDIEVGWFTIDGWSLLTDPKLSNFAPIFCDARPDTTIPWETQIRIIIGKVRGATKEYEIGSMLRDPAEIIAKAMRLKKNKRGLADMALRLFHGKMEIRFHRDIHRKIYIARRRPEQRPKILVGSANLSKEGIKSNAQIHSEILRRARDTDIRNIETSFSENWASCHRVSDLRFLRQVRKFIPLK
ncbi:MAG: hypothetical protein OXU65_02310 [Deltaproteobacteria bacterium]|nr:hypothetical protein [Deltaproteobacteria bacterium]